MKIVFIGAGNLATSLALELKKFSLDIMQVYSRTIASAQTLATQLQCSYTNEIAEISTDADLYIFSVKDTALESLLQQMPKNNGVWIHTAGSLPLSIFDKYTSRYGVVYPFQTFSKHRKVDFSKIPIFIESNTEEIYTLLKDIFSQISDKIEPLDSEKRKYIHLTGVFACNFVNHLYRISGEILESQGMPFDVLLPLIDETAAKVYSLSPEEAQTGPAIRFDENVIDKHLSLIDNPQWKEIYKLLSKDIHELNKQ